MGGGRRVACGVWCVVRGAWCVVCGVWCVVCSWNGEEEEGEEMKQGEWSKGEGGRERGGPGDDVVNVHDVLGGEGLEGCRGVCGGEAC